LETPKEKEGEDPYRRFRKWAIYQAKKFNAQN
jgi:hypothetical protein